jgi:hypothetical protein
MLWKASIALVFYTFSGALWQVPKVVSVCEVLTEPKKFDHQMVSIRAELVSSLDDTSFDELAPLESERCYSSERQDNLRIGVAGNALPNPQRILSRIWNHTSEQRKPLMLSSKKTRRQHGCWLMSTA